MLADVPTIDGREWKKQRRAFLESRLAENPSDEERAAIEAELGELKGSRWGWLWPRLPHQH
jgi:hypothetical protein